MSNQNKREIWQHPWSYREGTIITSALVVLGFALQTIGGGTLLHIAGFPWNLISGVVFIGLLVLSFLFLKTHTILKELGSVKTALPAILGFTFLVLLMGLVKQDVEPGNALAKLLGLNHLVKTWSFILINIYLLILLGIVTLKRLTPFNLKNTGFFLNHFGLFLVLFSTALGNSDVKRLSMNCYENKEESRATDSTGKLIKMPFTVKLLNFNIDEFRPKIAIADNKTGRIVLEKGKELFELLDRDSFNISQYHIQLEQFLEYSAKVDSNYLTSMEPGSVPSAKIKVTNLGDRSEVSGWICSGNYANQPEVLRLNDNHTLVMLPAEPRKFSSKVNIQTQSGPTVTTTIEVNKPFHIDGWTIYQLGYDTEMGRWSELSVLELVRDPWLPVVYLGIFMMMAGAVFLFIFGKPKNGGTDHVA